MPDEYGHLYDGEEQAKCLNYGEICPLCKTELITVTPKVGEYLRRERPKCRTGVAWLGTPKKAPEAHE